jgi:hypothetical protein
LKKNKLYAKYDKCEFGAIEVDFLGHRITQKGLKMDDYKVKEILDWELPTSILALRSFLGFLLLSQVHQKNCENSHAFDKPVEKVIRNL